MKSLIRQYPQQKLQGVYDTAGPAACEGKHQVDLRFDARTRPSPVTLERSCVRKDDRVVCSKVDKGAIAFSIKGADDHVVLANLAVVHTCRIMCATHLGLSGIVNADPRLDGACAAQGQRHHSSPGRTAASHRSSRARNMTSVHGTHVSKWMRRFGPPTRHATLGSAGGCGQDGGRGDGSDGGDALNAAAVRGGELNIRFGTRMPIRAS